MPDKKVTKSSASRPLTPSQRLEASLGDSGTINMAEPSHDKAKAALVDKFRDREERWRREQSLHEQRGEGGPGSAREGSPVSRAEAGSGKDEDVVDEAVALVEESEPLEPQDRSQGGVS